MYKLTIPKDLVPWKHDVEVFITRNIIEKDYWLLLFSYLGYNVYHIYSREDGKLIRPFYMFGNYYIKQYIETLTDVHKELPKSILEYYRENKIKMPESFQVTKLQIPFSPCS